MAGWLTLMVVIAVAGREASRELSVFQIMLLRSALGMAMLWPLVRAAETLAILDELPPLSLARPRATWPVFLSFSWLCFLWLPESTST